MNQSTISPRVQMHMAIGRMLDGEMPQDEAILALSAMDLATLKPDQLAGAVDAVMARCVAFPEFPDAVDCCGTGGDGLHTLNISTAVAIVVAACGVTVVKHGNRAVSSKSGSADVLEALGMHTRLDPKQNETMLRETGITFLYAPSFHPGFAHVAPIRKAIGGRTIFNLLGPLCNPARPARQLIGVFSSECCQLVAQTSVLLGRKHVAVVHGNDGSDELSITSLSECVEAVDGEVHRYLLRPQDAGLPVYTAGSLKGGDAAFNAKALREVLHGSAGAYADAVAMNAGLLLMVAEKVRTIEEGVILARSVIARGLASKKLEQAIEVSHA
jgi:anthranilate phosphoribosyltransferase